MYLLAFQAIMLAIVLVKTSFPSSRASRTGLMTVALVIVGDGGKLTP